MHIWDTYWAEIIHCASRESDPVFKFVFRLTVNKIEFSHEIHPLDDKGSVKTLDESPESI